MKIQVTVKTKSKISEISHIEHTNYLVRLKSLPIENSANKELMEILSKYFRIPQSSIKILKGLKSKNKLVELSEGEDSNKREKNI